MQQGVFLPRQHDALAVQRHQPRDDIDRKRTGPHYGLSVGTAQLPPQRRLAPRQQFRNSEGFDHVIVGAQLEQTNLFLLIGVNRENDDGNVGPRTNAFEHLGAFEIGQVKVENNQIRLVESRGLEPRGGILRFEHGKSMQLEAGAEKAPDLGFVVDDKHLSHAGCLSHVASASSGVSCDTVGSRSDIVVPRFGPGLST